MQAVYWLKERLVSCLGLLTVSNGMWSCGAVDADIVHKHGQEWEMIMMEYQAESDWLTQFADQGLRP